MFLWLQVGACRFLKGKLLPRGTVDLVNGGWRVAPGAHSERFQIPLG